MNKRIDRFLLGLLWLLATTLGASFWFNTKFGFNIFFADHWRYLGQLQVSNAAISPVFYTSMIIIVFLMIFGLYLIVRPRFRKINLQTENKPTVIPDVISNKPVEIGPISPLTRPPRLSIPIVNNHNTPQQSSNHKIPINTPLPASLAFETSIPSSKRDKYSEEIEDIFKNNGYLIKKSPKIGNFQPTLFAIGANEILWIGGVDVEAKKLIEAVEKLNSIFIETLEDITINIKPFIISQITEESYILEKIEKFDSINALREFIDNHKNREIIDSEKEDFDAYSEYIDTVADYFNKL
ncbi:MAG: hypothetical protein JW974_02735 [Alphaproteobacteria bacterium]|nr:hypothetical protein [Alphaproteobacteria bacterium]MBN2675568.1 hypothetical protein [Alphaproteobacteria bacterium]